MIRYMVLGLHYKALHPLGSHGVGKSQVSFMVTITTPHLKDHKRRIIPSSLHVAYPWRVACPSTQRVEG